MQPAINVARNGFVVTQDLVNQMNSATKGRENFLVDEPTWALDFAPNGTRVGLGDTMTRRRYADTLEAIARGGANAFYIGPIANATIQALRAENGTMTLQDLKNYTVAIRKPASITYRDYKLTACSAPSSGEVALSVMKTIEGYQDIGNPATLNLSTHRLDEAIRFAYGEVGFKISPRIGGSANESCREPTWEIHCSFLGLTSIKKKCSTTRLQPASGARSPIYRH